MPVFRPGPTIIGSDPQPFAAASFHASVSRGTTEEMITCSTVLHAYPGTPSSASTLMTSSSAVFDAFEDRRQCPTRSGPSNRPTTVWVLPTSTARIMAAPLFALVCAAARAARAAHVSPKRHTTVVAAQRMYGRCGAIIAAEAQAVQGGRGIDAQRAA